MDASTSSETHGLRVFVVENHADTRESLGMLLQELGHDVHCVATLAEAVASLARVDPDVVICDIGLPDGSGWDLLRRVPGVRYPVAMSGFGMNADVERSRAAGFRHHLVKPMDLERLESLLADAARERSLAG